MAREAETCLIAFLSTVDLFKFVQIMGVCSGFKIRKKTLLKTETTKEVWCIFIIVEKYYIVVTVYILPTCQNILYLIPKSDLIRFKACISEMSNVSNGPLVRLRIAVHST